MKKGDKVCIPTCKRNADDSINLEDTSAVASAKRRGQDFLYLIHETAKGRWNVGSKPGNPQSNFFERDLILYGEVPIVYEIF